MNRLPYVLRRCGESGPACYVARDGSTTAALGQARRYSVDQTLRRPPPGWHWSLVCASQPAAAPVGAHRAPVGSISAPVCQGEDAADAKGGGPGSGSSRPRCEHPAPVKNSGHPSHGRPAGGQTPAPEGGR